MTGMDMNIKTAAKLIAATFIIFWLAGCGGGSGGSTGTGTGSGGGSTTPAIPPGTKILVVNNGSNNVTILNAKDNSLAATVTVGDAPSAIAIHGTTNKAYIANSGSSSISILDTLTNTVTGTISTSANPWELAIDPQANRLYATLTGNKVAVIDINSKATLANITVGDTPVKMAIDTQIGRLYVTNYVGGSVSVIDTASNSVVQTLSVDANPYGVAVNPAANRLYVTHQTSNKVTVIDTSTNTKLASAVVGFLPTGITVNPNDDKVYVASAMAPYNYTVLDANGTMLNSLLGQGSPEAVTVNPASNYVYAANQGGNTMSIIDTNGLVTTPGAMLPGAAYKTYYVGTKPMALAIARPYVAPPANLPGTPPAGGHGDSWDNITARYTSVAYGNGMYVAVGAGGLVKTSPDANTWTARASGTENNLWKVIYGGGKFVAVGGSQIFTSTDGITWTSYQSSDQSLYGVAWSGSQYLVVGFAALYTSPDGITWTNQNPKGANGAQTYNLAYYDVAWVGDRFVVVGEGAYSSYTMPALPGFLGLTNFAAGSYLGLNNSSTQLFTAVAYKAPSTIVVTTNLGMFTSTDSGANWSVPASANTTGWWQDVTYDATLGKFIAVGGKGYSKALMNNRVFGTTAFAANQIIATSPDGLNWTSQASSSTNALSGVTSNTTTGEIVAIGDGGTVLKSGDGAQWILPPGVNPPLSPSVYTPLNRVTWGGPAGARLFVAVGNGGVILTSPDGYAWTKRTSGSTNNLSSVIWGGPGAGQFLAVSNTSVQEAAFTSPDGITWTKHAIPADGMGVSSGMLDVVWTGSKYVGVNSVASLNNGQSKIESADGVTWINQLDLFNPDVTVINARIKWDGYASRFIRIVNERYSPTTGVTSYLTQLETSFDAIAWEPLSPGNNGGLPNDVIYDNSGMYMVNAMKGFDLNGLGYFAPEANSPSTLAVSLAGAPNCSCAREFTGFVKSGSLMLALDGRGAFTAGKPNTWTYHPTYGASLTSGVWNGSVFVGIGPNAIAVSP